VYVLEEQELARAELVQLVDATKGLMVVGSSGSALEAFVDIVHLRPDVAVLDGRVGDGEALGVCRALRVSAPAVACVMLTTAVSDAWGPAEAAEAGAAAYLLKQATILPLIEVIAEVAAGARPLDGLGGLG